MSIQPLEGSLGSTPFTPIAAFGEGASSLAAGLAPSALPGDAISRMVPPWLIGSMSNPGETAAFGPLPGLMQQLLQMLQQLMGMLGGTPYAGSGNCLPYPGQGAGCAPYGNERFFADATGASQGDPHLSFNGAKWNSMASQPNLLESNSIPGGFRISTQVTPPNARGVTHNQSSTISLNNGATTISMDDGGRASIESYGRNIPISAGQTVRLGDGASVSCNQDGSLSVDACNAQGGRISTTLAAQGKGVNVDVTAHDVDLGGALVRDERLQPDPLQTPLPILDPVTAAPQGPERLYPDGYVE